jgi:two-component system, chemotaxis family, sensor kinase CheA
MEEFIDSFVNEAGTLLENLESHLLDLEKEPEDRTSIDSIFRTMHTIKGTAGMFGFSDMQNLAHDLENLFDKVRNSELKVTTPIIDITLEACDLLGALLTKADPGNRIQEIKDRLVEIIGISKDSQVGSNGGSSTVNYNFCILFTPPAEIFERGINPETIITELSESGRIKVLVHEGETSWEKQKKVKHCQSSWEIYLQTKLPEIDVRNIFMFLDEEDYRIACFEGGLSDSLQEYIDSIARFYPESMDLHSRIANFFSEIANEETDKVPAAKEDKVLADKNTSRADTSISHFEGDSTISISSNKIDDLLNLVSELVTTSATLEDYAERIADLNLKEAIANVSKLTKKFRTNALDLRLIPVGSLFNRFNRQVRDLSHSLNKEVNLILDGMDIEIDKSVLKAVESPLMHIIRNSIDHGIEYPEVRIKSGKSRVGTLKISAFYSGASVIIQVHDDGAGINLERVRSTAILKGYITSQQEVSDRELLDLIMEAGFTTNENVSLVSGRGVGMDVVKRELNEISGSLEIDTEKGLGTSITLKLPTTLSIIDTFVVGVDQEKYLLPMLEVEYCYQEKTASLLNQENRCLRYKDELIPFISLREKFNYESTTSEHSMVVIVNKYDSRFAIIVDEVIGEQQSVIKNLGEVFVNQPYFSGGNIMTDGKLVLILDTNYLLIKTKNLFTYENR